MTPRTLAVVVGLLLIAAGMLYALTRLGAAIVWTPWLATFAAGMFVGFRAGQYARGYAHARGIRRSHWAAIRGERR